MHLEGCKVPPWCSVHLRIQYTFQWFYVALISSYLLDKGYRSSPIIFHPYWCMSAISVSVYFHQCSAHQQQCICTNCRACAPKVVHVHLQQSTWTNGSTLHRWQCILMYKNWNVGRVGNKVGFFGFFFIFFSLKVIKKHSKSNRKELLMIFGLFKRVESSFRQYKVTFWGIFLSFFELNQISKRLYWTLS